MVAEVRLFSPEYVAERLVTDTTTVLKMVRNGTLKAVTLPGGVCRILPGSLDALMSGAATAKASPWLNADQAASYLGVSKRTLYNNRKHIPSLPGFSRPLMFDPEQLNQVRTSQTFRRKHAVGRGHSHV